MKSERLTKVTTIHLGGTLLCLPNFMTIQPTLDETFQLGAQM